MCVDPFHCDSLKDDEEAYLACQEEQKLCDNYEELVALALAGAGDDQDGTLQDDDDD